MFTSTPQPTYQQFRELAQSRGWSVAYVAQHTQADNPAKTAERILVHLAGSRLGTEPLPYPKLCQLYRDHIAENKAQTHEAAVGQYPTVTVADLQPIPQQYRPWLVMFETGWPVETLAATWSTKACPVTTAEVETVLDDLSQQPLPARPVMPPTIETAVTCGDFKRLAEEMGWSEDWLVTQSKAEMDTPRQVVREIRAGQGLTKPSFKHIGGTEELVSLEETALVRAPLLRLYHDRGALCRCGCQRPLQGKQKYATPACRVRAFRLQKL